LEVVCQLVKMGSELQNVDKRVKYMTRPDYRDLVIIPTVEPNPEIMNECFIWLEWVNQRIRMFYNCTEREVPNWLSFYYFSARRNRGSVNEEPAPGA